jgi:hypothetical protein
MRGVFLTRAPFRYQKEKNMKPWRIAIGAVGLSVLAAGALISSGAVNVNGLVTQAFAATQLSDAELQAQLQEQGYSNVHIWRHEGSRVKASAVKNGHAVQLALNGATGQPVDSDGDNDGDGD